MKSILAASALALIALNGCTSNSDGPAESVTGVWMATDPKQCLSNAWERDWIANHGGDEAAYPRGDVHEIEPEEAEIIVDYYGRNDVVVSEVASARTMESVCAACDCPQGHTLYLLVRPEDAVKLKVLGFRQEGPAS